MAPQPTSQAWAQIRYDYEHTDRLIADICAEHRISDGTLRDRVRRWNWTRRRAPIPGEGPPAVATHSDVFSPPPVRAAHGGGEGPGVGTLCASEIPEPSPSTPLRLADASQSDPLHRFAEGGMETANAEADPGALAPRLQSAVARVLPAIEATIAKLAAAPQRPREMEQTARTLGTLTRTLRELNTLLSQQPARADDDYDDIPENLDEFREHLARRIEAFMESREDEAFEVDAPSDATPGES